MKQFFAVQSTIVTWLYYYTLLYFQTHGKGRTRVGFIQVLVRRIKRLLTIHGAPARNEQMTNGLR